MPWCFCLACSAIHGSAARVLLAPRGFLPESRRCGHVSQTHPAFTVWKKLEPGASVLRSIGEPYREHGIAGVTARSSRSTASVLAGVHEGRPRDQNGRRAAERV